MLETELCGDNRLIVVSHVDADQHEVGRLGIRRDVTTGAHRHRDCSTVVLADLHYQARMIGDRRYPA
jgi:hypothetical protein